jgi:hypothetical protein
VRAVSQGADAELANAMHVLRALGRSGAEEGDDVRRLFDGLFSDGASSKQLELTTPTTSAGGLRVLRDMLELVLALPSAYHTQSAKEQGCMAVLVLDRVLHRIIMTEGNNRYTPSSLTCTLVIARLAHPRLY